MMKKYVLAALPVAAVLAGGGSMLSAKSSDVQAAPPASAFAPIQRFNITFDDPKDVGEFYAKDFGFSTYDIDLEELKHPTDESMRVVLVTADNIADDAVKGLQLRIGVRFNSGSWEAVEAGLRRQCYRGETAGKWVTSVCP